MSIFRKLQNTKEAETVSETKEQLAMELKKVESESDGHATQAVKDWSDEEERRLKRK
jgi:hypothetical protein